jgi:hypothetical protein
MRFLGAFLIIVAVASAGLYFMKMNFLFLNWITTWGDQIAWGIRGFLLLLGIGLFIVGKAADEEEAEEEAEEAAHSK